MVTRVGSVASLFFAVSPSGQNDTERKGTVEKCLAGGLNSPPDGLSVPLIVPEKMPRSLTWTQEISTVSL